MKSLYICRDCICFHLTCTRWRNWFPNSSQCRHTPINRITVSASNLQQQRRQRYPVTLISSRRVSSSAFDRHLCTSWGVRNRIHQTKLTKRKYLQMISQAHAYHPFTSSPTKPRFDWHLVLVLLFGAAASAWWLVAGGYCCTVTDNTWQTIALSEKKSTKADGARRATAQR